MHNFRLLIKPVGKAIQRVEITGIMDTKYALTVHGVLNGIDTGQIPRGKIRGLPKSIGFTKILHKSIIDLDSTDKAGQ